jgi:phage replication-related protein YjqB (UPF0714/DUF867 family)
MKKLLVKFCKLLYLFVVVTFKYQQLDVKYEGGKMTDKYRNYMDLRTSEVEGKDYLIEIKKRDSKYIIISPHGGGTEPGTSEISKEIAGDKYSYYSFVGNKKSGNLNLHIKSINFDEPKGIKLVENSDKCLAIHGCKGEEEIAYVGGKDIELRNNIIKSLIEKGFEAEVDNRHGKKGDSEDNICNRCKSNHGIQLELPEGLRSEFFLNLTRKGRKSKTEKFEEFVDIIKVCLDK